MKKMFLRFSAFAALLMGLWSCETEVDLNAPYESYTTIYGLLDLSADTQFVRINKSFLGEGSALDFAMIADSSEYPLDAVEARIEFGDNVVELEPIYIPNREPGVFYDEDVLVYITTENLALDNNGNPIDINSNPQNLPDEYRLIVEVNGKTLIGRTIPTYLKTSSITDPIPNNTGSGSIDVDLNWLVGPGNFFQTKYLKMLSEPSGVRYEAKMLFRYKDHLTDGTVKNRALEFNLGAVEIPAGSQSQQNDFPYTPQSILQNVASDLDCSGSVAYRTLDSAHFVLISGGEDLASYIDVNSPVTGIVTERPEFSNIEGENAIGLFSSRYTKIRSKQFKGNTREEIFNGEILGEYCFCDDGPGSVYPCPGLDEPCDCN